MSSGGNERATGVAMEISESLLMSPPDLVPAPDCESGDLIRRYGAYRERLRFHVLDSSNRCDVYCVSPGMVMAVVDVACTNGFTSRLSGQDIVEFHFRLSGSIVLGGSWGEVCVRDPSLLLWYQANGCNDAEERMGARDTRRETWVSLYCDRSWLDEIGGAAGAALHGLLAADQETVAAPRYRLCTRIGAMLPIVKDIVSMERRDPLHWLLAIGKANELLFVTLRNAYSVLADPEPATRLTERDRRLIASAREVLASEFATPPSVAELARRVGINTSKLCFGFKSQFGETTSDYVRRLRLELAHELLKNTDLQVRQIAWRAGYQHHSTFTAAFARHFGVAPKLVRRGHGALN